MSWRARSIGGLALIATGCGARTGLVSDPPSPPITFNSCREQPWLLFDVLGDQASGIQAMRADGTGERTVNLPHGPALFPSVSADGSKLLYATFLPADAEVDGGDDSALYVYDLASQAATLVVTTQQLTYSALSPDGQTVAYVSGYSLKAIGIDGSNDRTLLAGPNQDGGGYGHPAFLADPQTVIYGTNGSIGSIRIDGSDNQTLLTTIPDSFEYPNPGFSPDYTQLAVGSGCGRDAPEALRIFMTASLPGEPCGAGQFLVDVNEGASPNSANDPSWGSNGKIAYSSYPDVWVIDASGGTPTNMTSGLTGDAGTLTASDPRWAPGCWVLP